LRGISEAGQLHVIQHQGYLPVAGHHWDLVNDQLDPQGLGDDQAVRYTYYTDNGTLRPVPVTAAFAMAMGTDIRTDSRPNLEEDLTRRDLIALFHCPSQSDAKRGLSQIGPGWIAPLEYSSYVFNEAVMGRREHFSGRTEAIQGSVAKVRHSSQVFLAADGLPRGGTEGDVIVISNVDDHDTLGTFVESAAWGPEVARGHMDYQRHGYRINVVFLDGHAESFYMTDAYLRTIGVSEGIYN
jgi:prepilin-type processing-associated H-X9-DG protein